MSIECTPIKPLHIAYKTPDATPEQLADNFKRIERWANSIRITCSGCDCEEGGQLVVTDVATGTSPLVESQYFGGNNSQSYEATESITITNFHFEGTLLDVANTLDLQINGVTQASITLPAGFATQDLPVSLTMAALDTVRFDAAGGFGDFPDTFSAHIDWSIADNTVRWQPGV